MQFLSTLLLAPAAVMALPWNQAAVAAAPGIVRSINKPRQDEGATGRTIPVVVGGPQDVFVPNVVTAAVGDVVQFQFSSGNHTATQSTADNACVPLEGGVHSGHIPFEDGQTTVGTFEMTVSSTDTMFMYCATGPHCQEGQILVINPTDDNQVLDYQNKAIEAPENVDAGDVIGGTVGEIALADAVFVAPPAADEGEEGGDAAAPPAEEASPTEVAETPAQTTISTGGAGSIIIIGLGNSAADDAAAVTVTDGEPATTTVVVTVPAAAATETPAPAA